MHKKGPLTGNQISHFVWLSFACWENHRHSWSAFSWPISFTFGAHCCLLPPFWPVRWAQRPCFICFPLPQDWLVRSAGLDKNRPSEYRHSFCGAAWWWAVGFSGRFGCIDARVISSLSLSLSSSSSLSFSYYCWWCCTRPDLERME